MVVITSPSGDIEVQVQKPFADAAQSEFFQEYAKLGVRESDDDCKRTRYIVPETTIYAILIKLEKGFCFGKYPRVWILLHDEATGEEIFNQTFPKDGPHRTLKSEQVILIDSIDQAMVVDGQERKGAKLAFHTVSLGESSGYYSKNNNDLCQMKIYIKRQMSTIVAYLLWEAYRY